MGLVAKDPIAKIDEIIDATFNLVTPSTENRSKAITLANKIKALDVDFKSKSTELAELSGLLRLLSCILCVYNFGEEFDEVVIDRLSLISECDLDSLSVVVNNL